MGALLSLSLFTLPREKEREKKGKKEEWEERRMKWKGHHMEGFQWGGRREEWGGTGNKKHN